MRNTGRFFIAALAMGVVGALSVPVGSAGGRTSAPASSPVQVNSAVVAAPVVQVAPGQTQKMIATEKAKYDASRKIAEAAINQAEAYTAVLQYESLKVSANAWLKLAKANMSDADAAAKAENWSGASSYLIFANDHAVKAEQRAKVLAPFHSQIVDLLGTLERENLKLDKLKAKTKLAENAVNAAMIDIGKAPMINMGEALPKSMLGNVIQQVDIVTVRFVDSYGKFVTFY